jgi:hypothetical protein
MNAEWPSFEFDDFIGSSALTSLVMLLDQSNLTLRSLMVHGDFIAGSIENPCNATTLHDLYLPQGCGNSTSAFVEGKEKVTSPDCFTFCRKQEIGEFKETEFVKMCQCGSCLVQQPGYQTLLNFGIMPQVTSLQVPVQLDDVCFIEKIRQTFPFLKNIWLYLPSSKLLESFFKHIMDSDVQKLVLKTQFSNKGALESCLFPELPKD